MIDLKTAGLTLTVALLTSGAAHSDQNHGIDGGAGQPRIRADSHAPIGVMGDHMHRRGEWMLSYRLMNMGMDGSRNGSEKMSPEAIATTVANRFFGQPMQPPTLRVVPLEMGMEMHMVGAMYAPADWITLTAMTSYQRKDMDLVTFQGPAGTNRLGTFTTRSSGQGDTRVGALIALHGESGRNLHLNMAVSIPTGSTTETDTVLAPTGNRPTIRLPYSMQLGSGTYDLLPGVTYSASGDRIGWGLQYSATLRIDENDQGYSLGDEHRGTGWLSYRWQDAVSTSLRLTARTLGDIDGQDPMIVAPVQTADPDNYGGDRVDAGLGLNVVAQSGAFQGHRLAAEFSVPLYQHLNGPQLETNWSLTLGWQYAF